MKKGTSSKAVATRKVPERERGINLDVPGSALIVQAGERIAWHKRNAAMMEAELKGIPAPAAGLSTGDDWKQEMRRTDLARLKRGHEEYARFLGFVKRHISRRQVYRLSLGDLAHLEIMPKGSYL